jgi:lipopolysaccharide heptosyltransferase II
MKRILIANIFGIGDVLFTTALISNLKKENGPVSIDYLCNSRVKGMMNNNPEVDEVFVYEKDTFIKLSKRSRIAFLKSIFKLYSNIRKNKYDIVFDFTLSRKFGLFFFLAGCKRRVGLNYKKRGLFLTDKIPFVGFEKRHVIEYYLDLLKLMGLESKNKKTHLFVGEEDKQWAEKYLNDKGFTQGKLVAVVPGGGASWGAQAYKKQWKISGFSEVADILIRKGMNVAVLGDSKEETLCKDVINHMKEKPLFVENALTLDKYCSVLDKCDLVLCNDGGALHMAVALDVKTVSIFGPVDPAVYGPYPLSENHKIITNDYLSCRPCYNKFKLPECNNDIRCLSDIDADQVADKCREILK